jgi:hypothetical protein
LFLETLEGVSTDTATYGIEIFMHKFPNILVIRVEWRLREIFLGLFYISLEEISFFEIEFLMFGGLDCSYRDIIRQLWGC